MSKRISRILSLLLALGLLITPMAVLANGVTATIEGTVFNDANQNGVFDEGDTGIDGVTVELFAGDSETATDSVITSGDGLYEFLDLSLVDYMVVETDPPDHVSTTSNEVAVTLLESDPAATVNFGDAAHGDLGEISGFVYDDTDRDGVFDDGEPKIPGVTVQLFGFDGAVIESATTELVTGEYVLSMALAGANTVHEIDLPTYYSTTPNTVEVELAAPGATVVGINFGDFIPLEGEVHRIDLMLMKFFDIALLDFQALRAMEGWGYGNIAKAYFLAQFSETSLVEILGMRETMGWGNIMKAVLGRAGLKGYNLGLIVSGREVPQTTQNLIDGCELINSEEQVQELFSLGGSNGSIKKACKLAKEVDGATFETLVEALELLGDHNQKQAMELLLGGATTQVNNDDNGEHGPPACKGKNKNDVGCSKK